MISNDIERIGFALFWNALGALQVASRAASSLALSCSCHSVGIIDDGQQECLLTSVDPFVVYNGIQYIDLLKAY